MSIGFAAKYAGRCGNCGEFFVPGDIVFYDASDDVVASACCGELEEPAAIRPAPDEPVMPRGKTAADRCDICFQVPASNGVCGCS